MQMSSDNFCWAFVFQLANLNLFICFQKLPQICSSAFIIYLFKLSPIGGKRTCGPTSTNSSTHSSLAGLTSTLAPSHSSPASWPIIFFGRYASCDVWHMSKDKRRYTLHIYIPSRYGSSRYIRVHSVQVHSIRVHSIRVHSIQAECDGGRGWERGGGFERLSCCSGCYVVM